VFRPATLVFSTETYVANEWLIFILTSGIATFGIYQLYQSTLLALGKSKANLRIVAWAVAVNLIGNWLLIPHFQILGAAIATLASNLTMALLAAWALKGTIQIEFPWKSLALTTAKATARFVVVRPASTLLDQPSVSHLAALISLGTVTYFALDLAIRPSFIRATFGNKS